MKILERNEAIRIRKEKGLSTREIAQEIGVSIGSVKRWVKGVPLTEEQISSFRAKGSESTKQKALKKRILFQIKGRKKKRLLDPLFVAGIMLYWGEGTKSRRQLDFTNSDPAMLRLFIRFMKKFYPFSFSRITVYIHCYTDVHSQSTIENYWLKELSLTQNNLRKTMLNKKPINSLSKRTGLLPYGVCKLRVSDVSILQEIYGAIQEFCGETVPSLSPEN
jgi:hypothetical protein